LSSDESFAFRFDSQSVTLFITVLMSTTIRFNPGVHREKLTVAEPQVLCSLRWMITVALCWFQ